MSDDDATRDTTSPARPVATKIPVAALADPVILLATGLGSGLLRPAPGTWGTLAGLPALLLFAQLPLPVSASLVLAAGLAGIALCGAAGRRLGVADHGGIVWDEWVGVWLALVWFPVEPVTVLVGFVAFRVLDIAKPWPISWADARLKGGLGVMLDDILAGLLAIPVVMLARTLL